MRASDAQDEVSAATRAGSGLSSRDDAEHRAAAAISAGSLGALCEALAAANESLASFRFRDGAGVLHVSAATGPSGLTRELLQSGCSPNAQGTGDGATPLHVAASAGRLGTVELLLDAPGVDDTLQDHCGRTAADVARGRAVSAALAQARARFVSAQGRELADAVAAGGAEGVARIRAVFATRRAKVLVDVNAHDASGETLLHRAARAGDGAVVSVLLAHGADAYAKSRRGRLPVEVAPPSIRQLLLDAPMAGGTAIPAARGRMAGHLLKYVNFATGYRRRYVVLDDGVLSYYRAAEDYPVAVKGAVNVSFARLHVAPGDRTSFELRTPRCSLFFKADSAADASRWVLALSHWQDRSEADAGAAPSVLAGSLGDSGESIVGGSMEVDGAAQQKGIDAQLETISEAGPDEYGAAIVEAREALAAVETWALGNASPGGGGVPTDALATLRGFMGVADARERYWRKRSRAEEAQRRALEADVRAAASGASGARVGIDDEFFDALDAGAASVELASDASGVGRRESLAVVPGAEEAALIRTPALPALPEAARRVAPHVRGYPQRPRTSLPVGSDAIPPLNIWAVVKSAIGKDITRIPMPVNFCEPLSMLQRLCEDLEYAELLARADAADDALVRIQYVLAFAVSGYASSEARLAKPFNPMLGETFEHVCPVRGYTYVAEQVSHHPPVSACVCDGGVFRYAAEVSVRTKFWGRSLELVPAGTNHVWLPRRREHYSWRKVTTAVHNIVVGRMWIDHYGVLTVRNHGTGDVAEVELHPTGWRTAAPHRVDGAVHDAGRVPHYRIDGLWSSHLRSRPAGPGGDAYGPVLELWRRTPLPPDAEKAYRMPAFALGLNELTPDLGAVLPATDSRLRPDQRAMEAGRFDDANALKVALEDAQRARRKSAAASNTAHVPRWFRAAVDADTAERLWEYAGGYWEARLASSWARVPRIFDLAPGAAADLAADVLSAAAKCSRPGEADARAPDTRSGGDIAAAEPGDTGKHVSIAGDARSDGIDNQLNALSLAERARGPREHADGA